ncbi:sulfotransferase domain-containing protein [Leptothoe sp. EHU-05/26/07-4]
MIPDFALIGAVRSGTTVLSNYIMQHPCVVLPLAKEIGLNIPTKELILAQFPTQKAGKKVQQRYGKAITGYCTPLMPRLDLPYFASALTTNVKIIIMMRDPVERAFAQWRWDQVLISKVKQDPLWKNYPSFEDIIRLEIEYSHQLASISGFAISGPGGGYIQLSHYLPFIKKLFEFFDREQVLFINASDFFEHPVKTTQQIYQFLELPDYELIISTRKNSAPPDQMTESAKQLLSEFFKPINQELYTFIGQDFGWQ